MVENKFLESDSLRESHLKPVSLGTSCASPFGPAFGCSTSFPTKLSLADVPHPCDAPLGHSARQAAMLSAAEREKAKSKKAEHQKMGSYLLAKSLVPSSR